MTTLIVGTILALIALGFVLWPLFQEPGAPVAPPAAAPRTAAEQSAARRAVEALREVEFDRETGKLSDQDYAALRATYTREALAAMRAEDAAAVPDDEVEAVVLAYRARHSSCAQCGPRPEHDALYCSSCGRWLAGRCGRCGAEVTEAGARFCAACGSTLAA